MAKLVNGRTREEWAQINAAHQAAVSAADAARNAWYDNGMVGPRPQKAPPPVKAPPPSQQNAAPNGPAKRKHVPKARPWSGIPGGSDCFDDASYDGDGTLTVSFIGPKAGVYEFDVNDDEAREARAASREGALGEWWNSVFGK